MTPHEAFYYTMVLFAACGAIGHALSLLIGVYPKKLYVFPRHDAARMLIYLAIFFLGVYLK
jgi:hypothetical protein